MNYQVIGAVAIVVLIFLSGTLWISGTTKDSNLQDAEILGESLKNYFDLIDYRCRVSTDDYIALTLCTNKLAAELEVVDNVKEEDFRDARPDENKTGFLIIKNLGRAAMESDKFTLLKNRAVVDQGCIIPDLIDPGYTCRLEFSSPCVEGDVLEVKYGETRAYLKTC